MISLKFNFLAVLVTGILSITIGYIWYSRPVFGRLWLRLIHMTQTEVSTSLSIFETLGILLMTFISAIGLSIIINNLQITTIGGGISVSVVVFLGFVATFAFVENVNAKRPVKLYMLNMGYQLLNFIIMGIILTLWR